MNLVQQVPLQEKPTTGFQDIVDAGTLDNIHAVVEDLRTRLAGRVVWNINSTASGGGVAEMLHSLLAYARGLGVDTRWLVIQGNADFFRVTKRLHNALHGQAGDGSDLGEAEQAIYRRVTDDNAAEVVEVVSPNDIVILHDPQTIGLASHLKRRGAIVIWRCHIGDDHPSVEADRGWNFLAPHLAHARLFVFSRAAYIPPMCDRARSLIVAPSIDPFSPKNMEMDEATVRAVLVESGLVGGNAGNGSPVFTRTDGSPGRVERKADVVRQGEPPSWDRPLVVQVSRWDRLKDPIGVLEGFLKVAGNGADLVLAGPTVHGVSDDPEGAAIFAEIEQRWRRLPDDQRSRIHLANLPMSDLEENAVIVNALQRHAAVIVQKSLREGFGLTVTEAMWKARPVIASAVGGIQDQLEHEISGLLLKDPTDFDELAAGLKRVLDDSEFADRLGRNARERVKDHFLGLRSLAQYAELIQRLDMSDGEKD